MHVIPDDVIRPYRLLVGAFRTTPKSPKLLVIAIFYVYYMYPHLDTVSMTGGMLRWRCSSDNSSPMLSI